MRLIKSFIFLILLACLGLLLYFMSNLDEDAVQVDFQDQLTLASNADSLLREQSLDTSKLVATKVVSAVYEDYEVVLEKSVLLISKSNKIIYHKDFPNLTIRQILMSDMNEDDAPECWILGLNKSNKSEIFALEINAGQINRINFPTLKGRQAFGYAGGDSLYFDRFAIVRQFKYANDPYADLSSGNRACFYQFGIDQSFVLKKTLDLE